jgi:hypothetical protein
MLLPHIEDDGGYKVTENDIRFLGLSEKNVQEWVDKRSPLGLSEVYYKSLTEGLAHALDADNIDPARVTVTIRGSSVEFFAGRHKFLPWERRQIEEAIREHRGDTGVRKRHITEHAEQLLRDQWRDEIIPKRRPFDVMHKVGIARGPSDIDVELCSDDIADRCKYYASLDPNPNLRYLSFDGKYNYIDERYVRAAMPRLVSFAAEISDEINRDVNPVVFEQSGPPVDDEFTRQGWTVQIVRNRS